MSSLRGGVTVVPSSVQATGWFIPCFYLENIFVATRAKVGTGRDPMPSVVSRLKAWVPCTTAADRLLRCRSSTMSPHRLRRGASHPAHRRTQTTHAFSLDTTLVVALIAELQGSRPIERKGRRRACQYPGKASFARQKTYTNGLFVSPRRKVDRLAAIRRLWIEMVLRSNLNSLAVVLGHVPKADATVTLAALHSWLDRLVRFDRLMRSFGRDLGGSAL